MKVDTLPETNSSHLKTDGWKTSSFWDGLFSGSMLVLGSVIDVFFVGKRGGRLV